MIPDWISSDLKGLSPHVLRCLIAHRWMCPFRNSSSLSTTPSKQDATPANALARGVGWNCSSFSARRSRKRRVHATRSKFTIEPLEPGFGYTLGNSLRRTLLSSIPGAAVTQVKIDGVLHEFSTVEGVTEDVTDIVLNLKELVIRSENEEPTTVHLRASGPAEVTAGDVQLPAGVEILNPDHKIATLNKNATLSMELRVEQGRGYVPGRRAAGGDRHDPDRRICSRRSSESRTTSSRRVSSR